MSVAYEELDGLTLLRLSRPEKLNAMTSGMWLSLAEALNKACRSASAIVVTGAGRAFSSGDDIGEMHGLQDPIEASRFFHSLEKAVTALAACRRPVVAAVNGVAVGGGAEVLLLMDYVVAYKGALIGFPESRIGLVPPLLLTVGLLQLGGKRARTLALSGRLFSAEEAMALGIVDEVVDGDPLPRALEVARELSRVPQQALSIIKAASLQGVGEALTLLRSLESLVLGGEAKERMRLFLEKKLR